jgi:hypothetical protein
LIFTAKYVNLYISDRETQQSRALIGDPLVDQDSPLSSAGGGSSSSVVGFGHDSGTPQPPSTTPSPVPSPPASPTPTSSPTPTPAPSRASSPIADDYLEKTPAPNEMAALPCAVDIKKYPDAPKWVVDAVAYMVGKELGPNWLECVAGWLAFEATLEFGKGESKVCHTSRYFG